MILLQNMLVLAVGEGQTAEGKTTMLASTVTLAATPQECQQLTLAQSQGDLRLTLRSNEDKHLVTSSPTRVNDIGKGVRDRVPEGDNNPEGTETSPGVVSLPPVPKEPVLPNPTNVEPKVVKETPKEEPKQEEPKLVKHTLTVSEGLTTQQFEFTKDPQSGEWRGGRFSKVDDEGPARKPAVKPTTQPATQPAPKTDGTQGDNNPASPNRNKP